MFLMSKIIDLSESMDDKRFKQMTEEDAVKIFEEAKHIIDKCIDDLLSSMKSQEFTISENTVRLLAGCAILTENDPMK